MKKIGIVFIVVMLFSCKSSKLVAEYRNPQPVIFNAYKVLLVGMTPNEEMRIDFETRIKEDFDDIGIEAVRSIDLFDIQFKASSKTEDELAAVEQQLLEKDFDAILFTKVMGAEIKPNLRSKINQLTDYSDFKNDFLENQNTYLDNHNTKTSYDIYNTETTVYCICVDKEKSLIWRGNIDVKGGAKPSKALNHYVQLIVASMKKSNVIFREN
ncbi:hypothetical protein KO500_14885 [Cellulophaga baltica]|uniref:hypothetical protein n=1 Tax=Cellulophaga TaxID=104264 RepID=UPI001C0746E4|nr:MULTISPECIES: hypothetical protein [Cellulophaga]MBU2997733.1 hypothetical protein [Cellulophaga baltica]MDO6769128.1 hypothetical protein [Cellulophaga sp. 1_MG-2023]